jgi:hypothetical protein
MTQTWTGGCEPGGISRNASLSVVTRRPRHRHPVSVTYHNAYLCVKPPADPFFVLMENRSKARQFLIVFIRPECDAGDRPGRGRQARPVTQTPPSTRHPVCREWSLSSAVFRLPILHCRPAPDMRSCSLVKQQRHCPQYEKRQQIWFDLLLHPAVSI